MLSLRWVDANNDGQYEVFDVEPVRWSIGGSCAGYFNGEALGPQEKLGRVRDDSDGVYRGELGIEGNVGGRLGEKPEGRELALLQGQDGGGEVAIVDGVGDVVGVAGAGERGVDVKGEADGLGAETLPGIWADGDDEGEVMQGDSVGHGVGVCARHGVNLFPHRRPQTLGAARWLLTAGCIPAAPHLRVTACDRV